MPLHQPEAGPSWAERAELSELGAVLDFADENGAKNEFINEIQRRALLAALPSVTGMRALDFGCGRGRFTQWLHTRGASAVGIDAEQQMIRQAQASYGNRFIAFDGEHFPVRPGSLDLILTVAVLIYFGPDLPAILAKLAELLRPGGRMVLLEQVTAPGAERGATLPAYIEAFESAGLTVQSVTPVRRGGSKAFSVVSRVPRLARSRTLAALVERDARRALPPGPGDYADVVFDLSL